MRPPRSGKQFALCVDNASYPASLERWKVYRTLPDTAAARQGQTRIIDESGEDYLYPTRCFRPLVLPAALARLFGPRASPKRLTADG